MTRALEEYQVLGIKTTVSFYQRIMHNPLFVKGNYSTAFLEGVFQKVDEKRQHPRPEIAIIAAAIYELERQSAGTSAPSAPHNSTSRSRWKLWARKDALHE